MKPESLSATLLQIVHYDPVSYWVLILVKTDSGLIRATGKLSNPIAGERLVLDGHYTPHHHFAKIFEFSQALVKPPEGEQAQIHYISRTTSAPEHLAKAMLTHFGDALLLILDTESHRLCEIKGISAEYAQSLSLRWKAEKSADRLAQVLLDFGLNPSLITQLRQHIGDGPQAADLLRENPYLLYLTFPEHVTIQKVRKLAQQFSLPLNHDGHLQATLLHLLHHNAKFGHSVMDKVKLAYNASLQLSFTLDAETSVFLEALNTLQENGHLVFHDPKVALTSIYHAENETASNLKRLEQSEQDWDNGIDVARLAKLLRKSFSQTPVDHLATCLQQTISHKVSLVTCDHESAHYDFIAALQYLMNHLHLNTKIVDLHPGYVTHYQSKLKHPIHSLEELIRFNPIGPPQHHRENPIEADVMIISHSEACDIDKMSALLAAIQNQTTVIFVANPQRLRPQGPGQPILDIINYKRLAHTHYKAIDKSLFPINDPSTLIKRIHQTKPTSLISLNCFEQEQYVGMLEMLLTDTATALNSDPFTDFSIVAIGAREFVRDLNVQIQQRLNPKAEPLTHAEHSPAENDMVRLIKPHYKSIYLPQGSLLKIEAIENNKTLHMRNKLDQSLTLKNIDIDNLVLGYVCPITAFSLQPVKNVVVIYQPNIASRLHQNFWNEILSISQERIFILGPDPQMVFENSMSSPSPKRNTQLNAAFKRYRHQRVANEITQPNNNEKEHYGYQ